MADSRWTSSQAIFRSVGLSFRMVLDSGPTLAIANAALIAVQGVLPFASLYLTKRIVDLLAAAPAKGVDDAVFRGAVLLLGGFAAVALLDLLGQSIARVVSAAQVESMTDHMQGVLHSKSIEVDLEYYENPRFHDTLRRAQEEAPFRPTRIVNGLIQVAQNSISLLAMLVILASFQWAAVPVLFLAAVPGLVVRYRNSNRMYELKRGHTAAERKAFYFDWMLIDGAYAKEIRTFGLGPMFIDRYRDLRRELRRAKLSLVKRGALGEFVAQSTSVVALLGTCAFAAYQAARGSITLGDFVMYFQALQRGRGFLSQVLGGLSSLYEDSLFLTSLHEMLELEPKIVGPTDPDPVPRSLGRGFAFERVGFRYPGGSKLRAALEDVSLSVAPGELIAIVGENGSGKSTLVKLLCRLYDPTEGVITLDGIDIRRFAVDDLRQRITVIFQDFVHYHLTARENIAIGDVSRTHTEAETHSAAVRAGAERVVAALPRGYETYLGKRFEDGEEISIGEWQKLSLARAMFREASLVVLDEPSSAMDAEAEYAFFDRYRRAARECSTVLISHRFSTVRLADRIYVLGGGRVIESGTHDELVSRGGTYSRLFEIQARSYAPDIHHPDVPPRKARPASGEDFLDGEPGADTVTAGPQPPEFDGSGASPSVPHQGTVS